MATLFIELAEIKGYLNEILNFQDEIDFVAVFHTPNELNLNIYSNLCGKNNIEGVSIIEA